jgi:hypothetical protein
MSTTPLPFAVPLGQYPPFAVVTETDHSAWVIIATTLCLSCILLFGIINIFIRRRTSVRIGLDEVCLVSSTVRIHAISTCSQLNWVQTLACIQSSIILGACAQGMGKSIELLSERSLVKVQQVSTHNKSFRFAAKPVS